MQAVDNPYLCRCLIKKLWITSTHPASLHTEVDIGPLNRAMRSKPNKRHKGGLNDNTHHSSRSPENRGRPALSGGARAVG